MRWQQKDLKWSQAANGADFVKKKEKRKKELLIISNSNQRMICLRQHCSHWPPNQLYIQMPAKPVTTASLIIFNIRYTKYLLNWILPSINCSPLSINDKIIKSYLKGLCRGLYPWLDHEICLWRQLNTSENI